MRRKRFIGVSLLVLFLGVSYGVWYFLTKKESVCHVDSTTGNRTTISIRWFEKNEHLGHGDFLGTCEEARTYVPDNGFEKALIYWGYDDVMDNYVLTANIAVVEYLDFGEPGFEIPFNGFDDETPISVHDFTGIEDFAALERLNIVGHATEELDLSNNHRLTTIYFREFFSVSKINLKNGNNRAMTLDLIAVPDLRCVQVDDATWSTANWSLARVGGTASGLAAFSNDCY